MKKTLFAYCLIPVLFSCSGTGKAHSDKWLSLFDGKSLTDWKVGDNAATFSVDSGMIIVHGNTAHLFYEGSILNHHFKNFECKAEVMTYPGANSGIYFHTDFQQGGWPEKGYEVYVKDYEWYTEYIKVVGKRVIIKINDKVVVDYTEPENVKRSPDEAQRIISSGTFALQGHDPKSIVHFKNILVKPLPE